MRPDRARKNREDLEQIRKELERYTAKPLGIESTAHATSMVACLLDRTITILDRVLESIGSSK